MKVWSISWNFFVLAIVILIQENLAQRSIHVEGTRNLTRENGEEATVRAVFECVPPGSPPGQQPDDTMPGGMEHRNDYWIDPPDHLNVGEGLSQQVCEDGQMIQLSFAVNNESMDEVAHKLLVAPHCMDSFSDSSDSYTAMDLRTTDINNFTIPMMTEECSAFCMMIGVSLSQAPTEYDVVLSSGMLLDSRPKCLIKENAQLNDTANTTVSQRAVPMLDSSSNEWYLDLSSFLNVAGEDTTFRVNLPDMNGETYSGEPLSVAFFLRCRGMMQNDSDSMRTMHEAFGCSRFGVNITDMVLGVSEIDPTNSDDMGILVPPPANDRIYLTGPNSECYQPSRFCHQTVDFVAYLDWVHATLDTDRCDNKYTAQVYIHCPEEMPRLNMTTRYFYNPLNQGHTISAMQCSDRNGIMMHEFNALEHTWHRQPIHSMDMLGRIGLKRFDMLVSMTTFDANECQEMVAEDMHLEGMHSLNHTVCQMALSELFRLGFCGCEDLHCDRGELMIRDILQQDLCASHPVAVEILREILRQIEEDDFNWRVDNPMYYDCRDPAVQRTSTWSEPDPSRFRRQRFLGRLFESEVHAIELNLCCESDETGCDEDVDLRQSHDCSDTPWRDLASEATIRSCAQRKIALEMTNSPENYIRMNFDLRSHIRGPYHEMSPCHGQPQDLLQPASVGPFYYEVVVRNEMEYLMMTSHNFMANSDATRYCWRTIAQERCQACVMEREYSSYYTADYPTRYPTPDYNMQSTGMPPPNMK